MPPVADRPSARRRGTAERRAVAVSSEAGRLAVAGARLAELARRVLRAERVAEAMVSLTFVTPATMARLNRRHLGHRGPTDVITFALGRDPRGTVLADVYVCPAVARDQAVAHGAGVREELARLVIHGVLHACGWEHPDDDRTSSPMWHRQEQLLRRLWRPSKRTT
jgi:probable rRNA maturation factor